MLSGPHVRVFISKAAEIWDTRMASHGASAVVITAAMLLAGCVQTSNLYAVRQWEDPVKNPDRDDRPRVNYGQLEAKASFVDYVETECAGLGSSASDKRVDPSKGWAANEPIATICVQRITAYAVDQCIMITRRQNVVAADANLALGTVTLASGLAALTYAVKGSTDDRLAAASLAGATGASNNGRSFIPGNVAVPVTAMMPIGALYAEDVGLTDGDIANALIYDPRSAHATKLSRWTVSQLKGTAPVGDAKPAEIPGDRAIVLLARIHDAIFSLCSANAYGLVPAAKPTR